MWTEVRRSVRETAPCEGQWTISQKFIMYGDYATCQTAQFLQWNVEMKPCHVNQTAASAQLGIMLPRYGAATDTRTA